jgi:hypothetical protein
VAAAARVHRRDELKPGRIDDAVVGPCDRDFAGFERLAQAVQNLRLEFRQFVEKQNTMMRQRDFTWPRPCSTADKRRHRGRMMRCAEGPSIGERAAREIPCDGMDQRNLEEFTRDERRQNRRQARGEHRFSSAGRSVQQAPGGGDLEGPGTFLALDVAQIRLRSHLPTDGGPGPGHDLCTFKVINELDE